MKLLILSLVSALVGEAWCGGLVWPGAARAFPVVAPYLRTIIPPQTKGFAYSTTQYINSAPQPLPLNYRPQLAYQLPQLSPVSPFQQFFYPVSSAPFLQPTNIFNPTFGSQLVPDLPQRPTGPTPCPPPSLQPTGDADTDVIDSAFPSGQPQQPQKPSFEAPQTESPVQQSPPADNFPFLPQFPQGGQDGQSFPQVPQFPQFPQASNPGFPQFPQGSNPGFPQFPQGSNPGFPQFPQGSNPGFPQFPQSPSNPTSPSFPSGSNGSQNLNDEDTVAVESA